MREMQVSKKDLRVARMVDPPVLPLSAGCVRLSLDLFALTSNNITYAAMGGPPLRYWDFFPGTEDWGRPPCWGFATVEESDSPGIEKGARFYGYFPIAKTLDVLPERITQRGFYDGAPHRRSKSAIYNVYANVTLDPAYDAAFEPEQALFRPLYATGWWAADCVGQGAPKTVVVSSASAKTALCMAHRLRRTGQPELVGVTSARNKAYVEGTALYDRTLTYDELQNLGALSHVVYVDFLGRDDVIAAIHRAIGPALVRSILIGATDWTDKQGGIQQPRVEVVGPRPEFFFVPAYAAGRLKSQPELGSSMVEDMRAFYPASRQFVSALAARGGAAALDIWKSLASGEASPRDGYVVSL